MVQMFMAMYCFNTNYAEIFPEMPRFIVSSKTVLAKQDFALLAMLIHLMGKQLEDVFA